MLLSRLFGLVILRFLLITLNVITCYVPDSANSKNNDNWISDDRKDVIKRPFWGNEAVDVTSNAHKCIIEIPTVALRHYKLARIMRRGSLLEFSQIETCCKGYTAQKLNNKVLCIPNCNGKCKNGHCITPSECICYSDFVKNDYGECVFACPLGCLNGQCNVDGSCKCDRGFKLDETKKFCRPICSKNCGFYQNCTAPETCSCRQGYKLGENGCQPVCDPDCGNGGWCANPNMCVCYEGYTLKAGVCQAECYQRCENGHCIEMNRCICFPGYKYHEATSTCIPSSLIIN